MTPTPELRGKLRKLINETIPQGKNDADTSFLDAELDDLIKDAGNIFGAAAAGWTIKAGMLQEKTESYGIGQEKYNVTTLKDQLAHALAMAQQYASMSKSTGSVILKLSRQEVL